MKSRKVLLNRMLQTLVDEWGHDEVAAALSSSTTSGDHFGGNATSSRVRSSGGEPRLDAIAQIERAALEGEQKDALLLLAERYDRKQFLPSVADVREFLIMMGERPVGLKDRKDAFRVLLRSLVELPVERLQQLSRTQMHSGPSELGPLSDAIAVAGDRLPRQRQMTAD